MPRIQVLPPGVVNQIAAGEVVERPASVVKELVENALDAGARHVQVDLEDGGLGLVRVEDDGCGMAPDDALLALERHATSKLQDAAGLAAIATMGFRGEALPAIASVSRLRLSSSADEGGEGARLLVEGGRIVERGLEARARGTTVEVRDLFFNTPARRKFMRAPPTEAGHASEMVIRLALGQLGVGFTLRSAGRVVLASAPGSALRDRAALALGRDAVTHLVSVEAARGPVAVRGVVTSPDRSQATGRALYLYVNGRYVRDRGAAHAVLRAFAGTLPQGRFPAGVLFVELPLGAVDVNVHPQKLEVRFAEPRAVYDALHHAVSEPLRRATWLRQGGSGAAPPDGPPGRGGAADATPTLPLAREDVAGVLAEARAVQSWAPPSGPADLTGGAADERPPLEGDAATSGAAPGYFRSLRYIGQHARTYLLCEAPGGTLVVIDQHASHERLLFQGLREARRARQLAVQPMLLPQIVTLPPGPARALEAATGELGELGLDVEPFGGDSFAVKGTPAILGAADLQQLLSDLALQFEEAHRGSAVDSAVDALLATVACHAAVRAHQDLGPDEARALLDGLDGVDFKARCPHGRPVVFELTLDEMERRVGRR